MLPQRFFEGDTVDIARSLVGRYLVRRYDGITLAARVTETEAYIGRMDKACHAYNYRKTERTKTLYAPPGTAYVYLIYGMHCCLNFVTEPEGEPAAVLIRGLSPRHSQDRRANGLPHGSQALFLCESLEELGLPAPAEDLEPLDIHVGKRIGIDYAEEAADFPWRFYL